ncbi:hypothetical protein TNCV_3643891 [Trichonephila clavipes]|nr:hypothetical protein TNCV_3643891 [Trichonephila clavipes]
MLEGMEERAANRRKYASSIVRYEEKVISRYHLPRESKMNRGVTKPSKKRLYSCFASGWERRIYSLL